MLRDVLGTFLDSVTEREFDGPLLALLAHLGFEDVHFTHGGFEFGKDVVAKRTTGAESRQYAIQSKAGDINLGDWRDVRPQIEEAAWNNLGHPNFSTELPRTAVLVTTGVLKGGAILDVQDLAKQALARNDTVVEVWDRSQLLDWFAKTPELGLESAGPEFDALISRIDLGTVTERELERYGRRWLPDAADSAGSPVGRMALESAVLANRLHQAGRLDLAAMVALHLFRAAWTTEGLGNPRSDTASSALRLFGSYVSELLTQVAPLAADPKDLARQLASPISIVTYNVVCSRLLELFSLLAIASENLPDLVPPDVAVQAAEVAVQLATTHPGCSRAVSDELAVGILAPALLLSSRSPEQLQPFLTRHSRWLLDAHDPAKSGLGLAAIDEGEEATIERLLGGPLESVTREWRASSYVATVLLDVAALAGLDALYESLVANVEAFRIVPTICKANEEEAHFRRGGAKVWPQPRLDYAATLVPGSLPSPHHGDEPITTLPALDALLLASSARSRHSIAALKALLMQRSNSVA